LRRDRRPAGAARRTGRPERRRARRRAARPASPHHPGGSMMCAATAVRIVLAAAAAALVGCDGGGPIGTSGCPLLPDASGDQVALPTWRLEDIQPESPRAGQTYGLDTFSGKVVIVTLVQGY